MTKKDEIVKDTDTSPVDENFSFVDTDKTKVIVPKDSISTDLKDHAGRPIVDRVVSILAEEAVMPKFLENGDSVIDTPLKQGDIDYEAKGFVKFGTAIALDKEIKDMINGVWTPVMDSETKKPLKCRLIIQHYGKPDKDGNMVFTQERRKTWMERYIPTLEKITEIINK